MEHLRDRPYGNANFLVDFGDGKAESALGGFSEVIFPTFEAEPSNDLLQADAKLDAAPGASANRLILKRGFVGSLELYAWWHKARNGRAPNRKMLQVKLLSEDHENGNALMLAEAGVGSIPRVSEWSRQVRYREAARDNACRPARRQTKSMRLRRGSSRMRFPLAWKIALNSR